MRIILFGITVVFLESVCVWGCRLSEEYTAEDTLYLFYELFLESILSHKKVTKEMILAAESIRSKYHIPMTVHLNILSTNDEGLTTYVQYLEEFGISTVRLLVVSDL